MIKLDLSRPTDAYEKNVKELCKKTSTLLMFFARLNSSHVFPGIMSANIFVQYRKQRSCLKLNLSACFYGLDISPNII